MELRASWLGEFLKHSVLIAGAIVVLLPFYLLLSYSLKSPSEIETNTGERSSKPIRAQTTKNKSLY